MLAAIRSASVLGIDAYDVTVEVDAAQGLPQWTIVGLAASAVKESRERVCAALVNSGFTVPPRRMTVNLAPADVRKDGTAFDLPIALGMLVATGQLAAACTDSVIAVGELGLDGRLRAVRGILPIARRMAAANHGTLLVPLPNVAEASLVRAARVAAPESLGEVVAWLQNGGVPRAPTVTPCVPNDTADDVDLGEVVGQATAKRALEIAAAGAHNMLLVGPPGAGKTMLARRIPTILPALTEEDALEVTAIHSVAGTLPPGLPLVARRPFRAPHHTITAAGLIGGGNPPRPGEASLAHCGVLFLDELLEFHRHVMEALRQPLEDGRVAIARAAVTVVFPARFTLVGAMNPCPCGYAGDPSRRCACSAGDIARYRSHLSGPMADRIDMHVVVGAVPLADLAATARTESSAAVRARVSQARTAQMARYASRPVHQTNAHAPMALIDRGTSDVTSSARSLLGAAATQLGLTARGYHRTLRVARTIADLDGEKAIHDAHVAEALRYRVSQG